MVKFIFLNSIPTKEDYFRAKLYDIPFVIKKNSDLFEYELIDFEQDKPFILERASTGEYYIYDIKFKNDIKVSKLKRTDYYSLGLVELPLSWLQYNRPGLLDMILSKNKLHFTF